MPYQLVESAKQSPLWEWRMQQVLPKQSQPKSKSVHCATSTAWVSGLLALSLARKASDMGITMQFVRTVCRMHADIERHDDSLSLAVVRHGLVRQP